MLNGCMIKVQLFSTLVLEQLNVVNISEIYAKIFEIERNSNPQNSQGFVHQANEIIREVTRQGSICQLKYTDKNQNQTENEMYLQIQQIDTHLKLMATIFIQPTQLNQQEVQGKSHQILQWIINLLTDQVHLQLNYNIQHTELHQMNIYIRFKRHDKLPIAELFKPELLTKMHASQNDLPKTFFQYLNQCKFAVLKEDFQKEDNRWVSFYDVKGIFCESLILGLIEELKNYQPKKNEQ